MTTSNTIADLAKALALAQGAMNGAIKDNKGAFANTKYASLASVWDACREPLTKNGLSVVQSTRMEGNAVVIITTLLHSSGEYISGEISLPPTKPDPQGHGSAITYARRYALAAMVGIAPEDDDGADASAPPNPNTTNKRTGQQLPTSAAKAHVAAPEELASQFAKKAIDDLSLLTTAGQMQKYFVSNKSGIYRLAQAYPALWRRAVVFTEGASRVPFTLGAVGGRRLHAGLDGR